MLLFFEMKGSASIRKYRERILRDRSSRQLAHEIGNPQKNAAHSHYLTIGQCLSPPK
jgi:hypothetical protein